MSRYDTVAAALPNELPPITRIEATKASARLWRKFVAPELRGTRPPRVRRCWISRKPGTMKEIDNGWARLVHDLSHRVFRSYYGRNRRPHDPLHARYETELAAYVAQSGWLAGTLKPKPKLKLAGAELYALKLARCVASIERWESKQRRATNALKRLGAKRRRLERIVSREQS